MIKPTKKYIIVEPKQQEKTTASGIVLPDSNTKSNSGIVIAIGGSEPEYNIGFTVIFKEWAGSEYEFKNKKYLIVKKEDIIAYEE